MYKHVFVAGTFDGLHKGHRFLLSQAFHYGEKVTIGLTSDEFVKKFKGQNAKFKVRKRAVEEWVEKNNFTKITKIISIDDPYEPAASAENVDALVVTAETRKRGEQINRMRKKRKQKELTLIEVPMVVAEDGKPISSTRTRNGEIDRQGRLVMPEALRPTLQRPLGKVLAGQAIERAISRSTKKFVVTVGDVTTKTFLDAGFMPDIVIIDGKVGRKPYHGFHELVSRLQPEKASPFQAKAVKSGPGFISSRAIDAIAAREPVIVVEGEEDLLALPAIAYGPAGALVYYGQPGKGIVEVFVNKKSKAYAQFTLGLFVEGPITT